MIVKFHSTGIGRGSGPVEYLLGKDGQREGATLDRGDPDIITALIDSSLYAKKYTSGVLSFAEADLPREDKDRIMSSFESALLPGLDSDQYACLWVEHRDKDRLELNFVVPNIELQRGYRLQPYYDRADRPRINAWQTLQNERYQLHDPNDPANQRELVTVSKLPPSKKQAVEQITAGLLRLAGSGELRHRDDVIKHLEGAGFTIARKTPKSLSLTNPDGGQNIRLKGMIYEQDFRFSRDLRGDIEQASLRYRAAAKERVQAARGVYHRGIELKQEQNRHRHKRPEFESKPFNFTHMAVGDIQRDVSYKCLLGRDLVSGSSDSGQLADYSEAERSPRQISQVEHYDLNGGGEQLFSLTDVIRNNRHLYVNQQSPRRGVDRINHD
ncbi:relaxase/mobilization nuclease domain-containing protein, partial [Photobacterium indicum]